MSSLPTHYLDGAALDWAVAHAGAWKFAHEQFPTMTLDPTFSGCKAVRLSDGQRACFLVPTNPFRQDPARYCPSTDWAHGGPIIEREGISVTQNFDSRQWCAGMYGPAGAMKWASETPLIAAMRCYVASKLGGTVEVPEELV